MQSKILSIIFLSISLLACSNNDGGNEQSAALELARAKAFISDVRSLESRSSGDTFAERIKSAFSTEVEMGDAVLNTALGDVLQANSLSFKAFGEAIKEFAENLAMESYLFTEEDSGAQLRVDRVIKPGSVTLRIDDKLDGVTIALEASLDLDIAALLNADKDELGMDFGINITGTVQNSDARLCINEGSIRLSTASEDGTTEDEAEHTGLMNMDALLDVEIIQQPSEAITNPVTFQGTMIMSVDKLSRPEVEGPQSCDDDEICTLPSMFTGPANFDSFEFSLTGSFSDTQENQFSAQMLVAFDGTHFNAESIAMEPFDEADSSINADEQEADEEENEFAMADFSDAFEGQFSDSNYIGIEVSMTFETELEGVEDVAPSSFSYQRQAPGSGEANIIVELEAQTYTAIYKEDDESLTISNQDNVQLTISFTQDDVEDEGLIGNLIMGEQVVGSLRRSDGQIVIDYMDGTLELFDLA